MLGQEVEAALHAAEHAERQHIDLHELEDVDVVLVPFDDLAILHRRRLDRDQVVQSIPGQDEAAGVLAEMARGADQLARQLQRQAEPPVLQIEVQVRDMFVLDALAGIAPDLRRQRLDQVFAQTQRLADVAQGAARAIAGDDGAEGGVVAAVGLEDPLHDDLAPLVLEIDIDVRGLTALLADEALEQQIIAARVDRGDAQHIADGGVGGRAAALAQDVLAAGEAHDRMDREEIGRIVQRADQIELVTQGLAHTVRQTLRIPIRRSGPGQLFEGLLRRHARRRDLVGILIGQFVE